MSNNVELTFSKANKDHIQEHSSLSGFFFPWVYKLNEYSISFYGTLSSVVT